MDGGEGNDTADYVLATQASRTAKAHRSAAGRKGGPTARL